jgi:hypothetical protein
MRQVWTCRSALCLLAGIAAILLFTLAASRPTSTATAAGMSAASSDCSEATARQVVQGRLDVNIFDLPDPVRQVLCGPFTGPGSNAMAVTIGAPTCWPVQNWAVFRFTAGDWQLVLNTPAYLVPPLVAVASDIRETTAVHRSGDARCLPTGGTHARIWHWNGTGLVAGAWKQVTVGTAQKKTRYILTPLPHGVTCYMTDDGSFAGSWVYCWIGSNPYSARHIKLSLDGRFNVAVTRASAGPLGIGGRDDPYGTKVTVGRFRCVILRSAIRCTVVQSGKGFLFNSARVRRVGS